MSATLRLRFCLTVAIAWMLSSLSRADEPGINAADADTLYCHGLVRSILRRAEPSRYDVLIDYQAVIEFDDGPHGAESGRFRVRVDQPAQRAVSIWREKEPVMHADPDTGQTVIRRYKIAKGKRTFVVDNARISVDDFDSFDNALREISPWQPQLTGVFVFDARGEMNLDGMSLFLSSTTPFDLIADQPGRTVFGLKVRSPTFPERMCTNRYTFKGDAMLPSEMVMSYIDENTGVRDQQYAQKIIFDEQGRPE